MKFKVYLSCFSFTIKIVKVLLDFEDSNKVHSNKKIKRCEFVSYLKQYKSLTPKLSKPVHINFELDKNLSLNCKFKYFFNNKNT